jgi:hypothetical protein
MKKGGWGLFGYHPYFKKNTERNFLVVYLKGTTSSNTHIDNRRGGR